MGAGTYEFKSRSMRAKSKGFDKVNKLNFTEYFNKSKSIDKTLTPKGLSLRESRDLNGQETLAIMIGIDFTGSMGSVPAKLCKDGLPNLIQKLFDSGIEHPQVAFLGIGDHRCDKFPFQVSQFEIADELLDKCLTNMIPEGGGGGNGGESYLLAWYHAAMHTSIDCFEKRGQKGVLITIGDEPTHLQLPASSIKSIFGGEAKDWTAEELLEEASKSWCIYHLNVTSTKQGKMTVAKNAWQNLNVNYINIEGVDDIGTIIADIVSENTIVNTSKTINTIL